eukprot:5381825-Amphidinium_carterae.1
MFMILSARVAFLFRVSICFEVSWYGGDQYANIHSAWNCWWHLALAVYAKSVRRRASCLDSFIQTSTTTST